MKSKLDYFRFVRHACWFFTVLATFLLLVHWFFQDAGLIFLGVAIYAVILVLFVFTFSNIGAIAFKHSEVRPQALKMSLVLTGFLGLSGIYLFMAVYVVLASVDLNNF